MRVIKNFPTIDFCLLFLVLIDTSSTLGKSLRYGFNTIHDIKSFDWKFPKDWPYHYYDSTKNIPQSILPVPVDSLPYGEGVWLITSEDFLGLPRVFQETKFVSNKSVISYKSSGIVFNHATIKALAFGNIQLDIMNDNARERQTFPENLIFSLFQSSDECLSNVTTENENTLRWTQYALQFGGTGQIYLQVEIRQPNSFLILDEITIENVGGDKLTEKFYSHDQKAFEEWSEEINRRKISCRIVT